MIPSSFACLHASFTPGFGSGDTNADGSPNWSDPWTLSDLIMDLLFCCDLALNFVTTGDM
jgi:hypothetical protein